MSLEELLKDPEGPSIWKSQRKKLLRIALGLLISAAALAGAAILVISTKRHPNAAKPNSSASVDKDANSLAQLMQIKKESADLHDGIKRLRQTASVSPVAERRFQGRPGSAANRIINFEPGEGFAVLDHGKSDLYIPTGAVFQARLLTPIKTSVQRTFVMAETTNEFRMDMKRRIPKGSRLIGRSYFDPVLKGVIVDFNTVVFPNGIETTISALALSRNALPELEGLYFSDRAVNYGTALAFGFLSGFADAAREREYTLIGSVPTVSVNNEVLTGLSTASFQVASDMLRDIQASSIEYVVVPAGEQVFVVLTQRYQIAQGETK